MQMQTLQFKAVFIQLVQLCPHTQAQLLAHIYEITHLMYSAFQHIYMMCQVINVYMWRVIYFIIIFFSMLRPCCTSESKIFYFSLFLITNQSLSSVPLFTSLINFLLRGTIWTVSFIHHSFISVVMADSRDYDSSFYFVLGISNKISYLPFPVPFAICLDIFFPVKK